MPDNSSPCGSLLSCNAPLLSGGEDQVAAALQKIAEHISNAKNFRRASPLLRQLLQDGKVQGHHADLLFQVRSTRAPGAVQAVIWLRNYGHVANSPKLGEACHVDAAARTGGAARSPPFSTGLAGTGSRQYAGSVYRESLRWPCLAGPVIGQLLTDTRRYASPVCSALP